MKIKKKLFTVALVIYVGALMADRVLIDRKEALIIAKNPATRQAEKSLKSLLNKPILGSIAITQLLKCKSPDFAIEFRRRLYRTIFRSQENRFIAKVSRDFANLAATRSDFLKDGSLIESFPDPENTVYQDALALWMANVDEADLETFYWAIYESPPEYISSLQLEKILTERVDDFIHDFTSDRPKLDGRTFVNVGYLFERLSHPGLLPSNSKILSTLVSRLERSEESTDIPFIKRADVAMFLYAKCSKPLVRSALCDNLLRIAPNAAKAHFRLIERSLPPIDRKAYLCCLASNQILLSGFEPDDAFRDGAPRIVRFNIYNIVGQPSFKRYAALTGKGYFEKGKSFPLPEPMNSVQAEGIHKFVEDFPYHPGADDACYRLGSYYLETGQQAAARDIICRGLNSTDTDAHSYLKLLLIHSLVKGGEATGPVVLADLVRRSEGLPESTDAMVASNQLAFLLPQLLVEGRTGDASQVLGHLRKRATICQSYWKMSDLVWAASEETWRTNWLKSCEGLLTCEGRINDLVEVMSNPNSFFDDYVGMPSAWNSLSLKNTHDLERTRQVLIENSIIYRMFSLTGSGHLKSNENYCSLLCEWLRKLREVPNGTRYSDKPETFVATKAEREVAAALSNAIRKRNWLSYTTQDIKLLNAINEL